MFKKVLENPDAVPLTDSAPKFNELLLWAQCFYVPVSSKPDMKFTINRQKQWKVLYFAKLKTVKWNENLGTPALSRSTQTSNRFLPAKCLMLPWKSLKHFFSSPNRQTHEQTNWTTHLSSLVALISCTWRGVLPHIFILYHWPIKWAQTRHVLHSP